MSSSSQIRSCDTSAASPTAEASKLSSPNLDHIELKNLHCFKNCSEIPSRLAMEDSKVAPVAFAMRLRSAFLQRRTAMAPASTKY